MNAGIIISLALIVVTIVLSNMFGETRATKLIAKELKLIREHLENKDNK